MYHLIHRGQSAARWERPSHMPVLIYELLLSRGIGSAEEAEAFLHPSEEQLLDPFRLQGMEEAVSRIRRAREAGERVCVFGDYDVDGVCATAILIGWLRGAGVNGFPYIPDRHSEGYGLNENAVREIAEIGRAHV